MHVIKKYVNIMVIICLLLSVNIWLVKTIIVIIALSNETRIINTKSFIPIFVGPPATTFESNCAVCEVTVYSRRIFFYRFYQYFVFALHNIESQTKKQSL